jgi:hypothetical protein
MDDVTITREESVIASIEGMEWIKWGDLINNL